MGSWLGRNQWGRLFAVGLIVRPLLLLPLLDDTSQLPLILGSGLVVAVVVAIGVLRANRIAIAFGIYGSLLGLMGIPFGASFGWPPAWMAINAVYGLVVAGAGVLAWREARPHRVGAATPPLTEER